MVVFQMKGVEHNDKLVSHQVLLQDIDKDKLKSGFSFLNHVESVGCASRIVPATAAWFSSLCQTAAEFEWKWSASGGRCVRGRQGFLGRDSDVYQHGEAADHPDGARRLRLQPRGREARGDGAETHNSGAFPFGVSICFETVLPVGVLVMFAPLSSPVSVSIAHRQCSVCLHGQVFLFEQKYECLNEFPKVAVVETTFLQQKTTELCVQSQENIASYLQTLCLTNNVRTDFHDMVSLVNFLGADIRKCMNTVQFWMDSGESANCITQLTLAPSCIFSFGEAICKKQCNMDNNFDVYTGAGTVRQGRLVNFCGKFLKRDSDNSQQPDAAMSTPAKTPTSKLKAIMSKLHPTVDSEDEFISLPVNRRRRRAVIVSDDDTSRDSLTASPRRGARAGDAAVSAATPEIDVVNVDTEDSQCGGADALRGVSKPTHGHWSHNNVADTAVSLTPDIGRSRRRLKRTGKTWRPRRTSRLLWFTRAVWTTPSSATPVTAQRWRLSRFVQGLISARTCLCQHATNRRLVQNWHQKPESKSRFLHFSSVNLERCHSCCRIGASRRTV